VAPTRLTGGGGGVVASGRLINTELKDLEGSGRGLGSFPEFAWTD
jgi:hypothetical protein